MENATAAEGKSDEELVALTLACEDNFIYLMRRYQDKLCAFVRRISYFDVDEAADIVQESFIKAYQNLNDFNKKLKFSSWIYRITRNQTISAFRRSQARPQIVADDEDETLLNRIAADTDLEKELDQSLQQDHLREVLGKTKKEHREVLVLHYLEDKSYQEMADILQKPVSTVGTLLHRAKRELSQYLNKKQHERLKPADAK